MLKADHQPAAKHYGAFEARLTAVAGPLESTRGNVRLGLARVVMKCRKSRASFVAVLEE